MPSKIVSKRNHTLRSTSNHILSASLSMEFFLLEKKIYGKWSIDWDWLYGSLDKGEYRIVKGILDF